MKSNFLVVLLFITGVLHSSYAYSYSFNEAIEAIKSHDIVSSLEKKSKALIEEGESKGSWGDPMFRVAAKNYPKDSLKDNETPMTGIEFGVAQKVALTTKYGNIEDAFAALGQATKQESENKTQELIRSFWEILIENKKLDEEINIIKENLNWIKNILKVSKRLWTGNFFSDG